MESSAQLSQVKIAILGGSGATGREIIRNAKQDPRVTEITIVVRRTLEEWKQEDFSCEIKIIMLENLDNLEEIKEQLMGNDIFISCLGARQKVGSKEFQRIERDVPANFARIAKECGATYFSYLSSMMVNKKSMIQILRVKAETEELINNQELPIATMFRPGVLVNRDNDFRWIEWILAKLPGSKIEDKVLAYAMYHHAVNETLKVKKGERLNSEPLKLAIENADIKKYADMIKKGILQNEQ
ncbi:UNKNOWN [Stylonychia lemnae]|uniref:NAD(P)-binding domain-containing protein n=1 Tax=Stylonychia lemnae TaxID=5949 RepID=A0A078A491_STYLE|nr:UNKNOWN [Stylonychia lemnae]|eukprot:CDW75574.1 UNKNOWN [Stylonychia lemnae]